MHDLMLKRGGEGWLVRREALGTAAASAAAGGAGAADAGARVEAFAWRSVTGRDDARERFISHFAQQGGGSDGDPETEGAPADAPLEVPPEAEARRFAEACAVHFAHLGEQAAAALARGGDDAPEWRELFESSAGANSGLPLAGADPADPGGRLRRRRWTRPSDCGARDGARRQRAVPRVVAAGVAARAARAAEATVLACEMLGSSHSRPAAQALTLLGDTRLQLGEVPKAQEALQKAVSAFQQAARRVVPRAQQVGEAVRGAVGAVPAPRARRRRSKRRGDGGRRARACWSRTGATQGVGSALLVAGAPRARRWRWRRGERPSGSAEAPPRG